MLLRVLGGLEFSSSSGEPVRLATRKSALICAALALAGRSGMSRDALCGLFWPDRGETQARSSLRQALVDIRHVFPDGGEGGIHLDSNAEAVLLLGQDEAIDARLFDELFGHDSTEDLGRAADLYRGGILEGVAVPEPADQWFAIHRAAYLRRALHLVESLSLLAAPAASKQALACARLAERLLAAEPTAEEAHRALIRQLQRQGNRNAALRQFLACKEALSRDLGVEPEEQTQALLKEQPAAMVVSPEPAAVAVSKAPPAAVAGSASHDGRRPTIAILPFDNLSGPADDDLVTGVVEEITATLSRIRDFFVIARQSAAACKQRFAELRDIGQELGVRYLVDGTVRRAGDDVRIAVRLIDPETRRQLWFERYDGKVADIFEFQDRIASRVAGAIHPALLAAEIEAATRKPPDNLEAYHLVLRAYPKLWSASNNDNAEAMALLRQADALDPNYGRARALLAWCHAQNLSYMWSSDPEWDRRQIADCAAAASPLIDDDPMALTAVGAALSQCVPDQERAATFIERALALDPNNAWAWARYGWIAFYRAEPETAKARFERAMQLSPFDPLEFNFKMGIAGAAALRGDFAEAARVTREVIVKHPQSSWAYRGVASYSALAGDLPAAREAMAKLREAHPYLTIAVLKATHPSRQMHPYFDHVIDGLRLAGLPEE